jgi:hypothetical protein
MAPNLGLETCLIANLCFAELIHILVGKRHQMLTAGCATLSRRTVYGLSLRNSIYCALTVTLQLIWRIGSGCFAGGVFSMDHIMAVWTKWNTILDIIVFRDNVMNLNMV